MGRVWIFTKLLKEEILDPSKAIADGADVNAKDKVGVTPLTYATFKGAKEITELLITTGADVNAKDVDGRTPLHRAASYSHNEVAELLIAKGADVNAKMMMAKHC